MPDERELLSQYDLGLYKSPMPGYLGGVNYISRKGNKEFILVTTADVTLEPNPIVTDSARS